MQDSDAWKLELPCGANLLRVEFRKQGARFAHGVNLVAGGAAQPLLDSIQTDDQPAYQELHRQEEGPHGPVLFLTGMAAARYWSASVSCRDGVIEFDVACREKTQQGQLALQYELAPGVNVIESEGNAFLASVDFGDVQIKGDMRFQFDSAAQTLSLLPSQDASRWVFTVGPVS